MSPCRSPGRWKWEVVWLPRIPAAVSQSAFGILKYTHITHLGMSQNEVRFFPLKETFSREKRALYFETYISTCKPSRYYSPLDNPTYAASTAAHRGQSPLQTSWKGTSSNQEQNKQKYLVSLLCDLLFIYICLLVGTCWNPPGTWIQKLPRRLWPHQLFILIRST